MSNGYDISKLVSPRRTQQGWACQCPACAEEGKDLHGRNHLLIRDSGQFGCAVNQSKEHYRRIYQLLRDPNAEVIQFIDNEPTRGTRIEKIYPEETLNRLLREHQYWLERGIKSEVLDKLKGGLAPKEEKSKLSNRFVFPCRNQEEQIIGFAGRLVEPNSFSPKWKILGKKGSFIFPSPVISQKEIERKSEVVLVEGIGCVMALGAHDVWNTLCLFGLNISSTQIGWLLGLGVKRIIIATNNEVSGIGNEAAVKLRKKLQNFFNDDDIITHLPIEKDFMDMKDDQMREWIKSIQK